MTTPSSPERWDSLKREALAVLAVAGSITAGLWFKRLFEKLTHSKIIDPHIVKNGLKPEPTTTPQPPPQHDRELPEFRASHTSPWSSPLQRPPRSGPGRVWVDGVGSIVYRAKVQTADGYTLYDHDHELHPSHLSPCPLLRVDETCDTCEWHIADGPYRWQPQCAALVKLHEEPQEDMSLSSVRRQLEGSI